MKINQTDQVFQRTSRATAKQHSIDSAIAWHPPASKTSERSVWLYLLAFAVALIVLGMLSGCADDLAMHAAVQADLADAISQAWKEAGR